MNTKTKIKTFIDSLPNFERNIIISHCRLSALGDELLIVTNTTKQGDTLFRAHRVLKESGKEALIKRICIWWIDLSDIFHRSLLIN